MASVDVNQKGRYHTAKKWQIGLFALNDTATNLYMFIMIFVSYYATGVVGLTVVVVSSILSSMRVFDGIIDPVIGYIIDKTERRFGKFVPLMILGNITLAITVFAMFTFTHLLQDSLQFSFFIVVYAINIIGYTFQTACTRGAQTILTNDPNQRPLFSFFTAFFNSVLFIGGQMFIANYLIVKHGDFTLSLFNELKFYAIAISAILTCLAVFAIKGKDRKEYYGLADENDNLKFKDYWPVLKENRPLQMLIVAASTDKLAMMMPRQAAVGVMFFGILLGDYALSGTIGLITFIPTILIVFFGIGKARKIGLKRAFVFGTWLSLFAFTTTAIFLLMVDSTTISLTNFGLVTALFLVLYSFSTGLQQLTGNMVIPMIADVSDYETYRTGRYVPGMISTIFSLVDKLISSLAPAITGFAVVSIGYRDSLPDVEEELTTPFLFMVLLLKFGFPIIGYVISLIVMKFYLLDDKKMEEIQGTIHEIKKEKKEERII
ncbi:MFS transporter [Metabacillus litoralis]|uniref:MFS transporter n=1 Tax=Metabacillus litoralis TaxID=152268 RepID=UPI001CFC5BDF|nr:MFS transporter [Metabacillus litoralis]